MAIKITKAKRVENMRAPAPLVEEATSAVLATPAPEAVAVKHLTQEEAAAMVKVCVYCKRQYLYPCDDTKKHGCLNWQFRQGALAHA